MTFFGLLGGEVAPLGEARPARHLFVFSGCPRSFSRYRARLKAKGLLKALGVKDFRPEEAGDLKAIHSKKHGDWIEG